MKPINEQDIISDPKEFFYSLMDEYAQEYYNGYKESVFDAFSSFNEMNDGISIHKTRPFYTVKEISRFQLMYGKYPVNCVEEEYDAWLKNLKDESRGFITEQSQLLTNYWIESIQSLQTKKSRGENVDKDMRLFGWNPVMKFNATNVAKANKRFEDAIYGNINERFRDINPLITERSMVAKKLNPLFIVLVEGDTPIFSQATKLVTKGPFSHASLGLSPKLDKLYSFNLRNGVKNTGGFSIENIKNYPKDGKLGVFCIFIKDSDLEKIENMIHHYTNHIQDTAYSILNVLAIPFNAAIKMDFKMICSEFVDSLLKICDINIVDKASPLVTPNDFYRSAKSNSKIYKIYEGMVHNYREASTRTKLLRIEPAADLIKEAAEFPVQFSSDGDLLIKKMGHIDYEEEYRNSHRLLQSYSKTGNIDGIKYELSKLYFLNLMIERDIYYNNDEKKKSYMKCRARILNDFSTYLKMVLNVEPSFNFDKYFKESPFNYAVTKINRSTLKYSIDYLKQLLSPI